MKRSLHAIYFLSIIFCYTSCEQGGSRTNSASEKIYRPLTIDESGIDFLNKLTEDSVVNYFTYPYIYMGGGVAVGDVNNDGLQDIYFTGNMVKNRLYLNQGELRFTDITDESGTGGDDRWVTGATMVDINADGMTDLYVSVSGKFTTSKNLMFINRGNNENGIPVFEEMAEAMGIADAGKSTQGTFFDYDKDGDLDLYVVNYPLTNFKTPNVSYQLKMALKEWEHSDKLYRNKGDATFEEVTLESGILNFGLGLSATVGDFDKNGWEDIYVSNDFATPDYFYFNNGDGTFSERLKETTQHTSYFGMGTDVADFNNDGLLDILQLDMTPEDNRRNKANMASMNPAGFWEMVTLGFHYQYMQNTLQLNNGLAEDGLPHFSDIARITGTSSTDWSWAGLISDFDNDGLKDIFITNGTRKDINNKDYFKEIDKASSEKRKTFDYVKLSQEIPSERVPNYAFKNNGDLTFTSIATQWGVDFEGFSNGAAYADLDNDGDLELIVNNIDDPSVIYQNLSSDLEINNYLRIRLKGYKKNTMGLGTRLELINDDMSQYQELTLARGFQSSVEPVAHFGLGGEDSAEKLIITWPDGKTEELNNIRANQLLEVDYKNASFKQKETEFVASGDPGRFVDLTKQLGIDYLHVENPYNDFRFEVLLPHIYSKNGPGLAIGDINGDNLQDFFVGGAIGGCGMVYLQNDDGSFRRNENYSCGEDIDYEDMGATFFDADSDGDLDLYIVSGGNEYMQGSPQLQDRLYINDGNGNLQKLVGALPAIETSGSRVKAADYDNDGDPDLFVGGRIVPKSYPLPAKSYILRNDTEPGADGKIRIVFTDVTDEVATDLLQAGLVTDAVWVDYNGDKLTDLVVVGEWMPITFLRNNGEYFENTTEEYGLEKSTGWWYSIAAADFDKDGDQDLVAGNLGLNYKYQASQTESFDVYAYDYDQNGQLDIVLGYYNEGVQYPLRGRQCSSEQIPAISVKFEDYNSFAIASLEDVYGKRDLEASLHYQAWNFASSYIENKGNETFAIRSLPNEVQLSSVNGIVVGDFNQDGHLDMVVAGNLYGAEVETTRNDAGYGKFLAGDGNGNFQAIPNHQSGLFLRYDTKDLGMIETVKGSVLLAANNQDSLRAIGLKDQGTGYKSTGLATVVDE